MTRGSSTRWKNMRQGTIIQKIRTLDCSYILSSWGSCVSYD